MLNLIINYFYSPCPNGNKVRYPASPRAKVLVSPRGHVKGGQLAGFYDTELTDAGVADSVLGTYPRRFEALNANGFHFSVPGTAVELARGPVVQAFRVATPELLRRSTTATSSAARVTSARSP